MLINPRTLHRLPHRLIAVLRLILQVEIPPIGNDRLPVRPRGDLHTLGVDKAVSSRKLQRDLGDGVERGEDVVGERVPGRGGHDGGAHGAGAERVDADAVSGFEVACNGAEITKDANCLCMCMFLGVSESASKSQRERERRATYIWRLCRWVPSTWARSWNSSP